MTYTNDPGGPRHLDLARPADPDWRLPWDMQGPRPYWQYVKGTEPVWMLVSEKASTAQRWFASWELADMSCGLELVWSTPWPHITRNDGE